MARVNRRTVLHLIQDEAEGKSAITGRDLSAAAEDVRRRLQPHHKCANKIREIVASLVAQGEVELREAMLLPVSASEQRSRKEAAAQMRKREASSRKLTSSKRAAKKRKSSLAAWHRDELTSAHRQDELASS